MPIITSPYRARGLFKDAHFSTIYSAKIRRVGNITQQRERITLPDGDYIDVDWSYVGDGLHPVNSKKINPKADNVVLLFHGLEGNAQRPYMMGLAKLLNQHGYDAAAVNFRGCSGSKNIHYRSYHSGETGDIRFLVNRMVTTGYKNVSLYGVSLGGNAVLKYLGEQQDIPKEVVCASCIGVPSDLKASLEQLDKPKNIVYRTSFLVHLRAKYRKKMVDFPDKMSWETYRKIDSLKRFDDLYTAPAHGFEDALDYYANASSFHYLNKITIPTLILNAKNDSFLHGNCYPINQAKDSTHLHLEIPEHGGHIGFYMPGDFYYNEQRTLEFFKEKTH